MNGIGPWRGCLFSVWAKNISLWRVFLLDVKSNEAGLGWGWLSVWVGGWGGGLLGLKGRDLKWPEAGGDRVLYPRVPPVQVGTGTGVYHLSFTLPPYIDGLLRVFGASFILFMFWISCAILSQRVVEVMQMHWPLIVDVCIILNPCHDRNICPPVRKSRESSKVQWNLHRLESTRTWKLQYDRGGEIVKNGFPSSAPFPKSPNPE